MFRVRFFSWDSSGAPKPHVFFTWRVLFVTYSDPVNRVSDRGLVTVRQFSPTGVKSIS